MRTLKQVIDRPSERENLRSVGICTLCVAGFVLITFFLLILSYLANAP